MHLSTDDNFVHNFLRAMDSDSSVPVEDSTRDTVSVSEVSAETADPQLGFPFLDSLCRVCKSPSTGVHYGVATCEGCKGFFKRSIPKSQHYKCYFGGDCEINRETRNRCKSCRFQRCVKVGMALEAVKMGRIPKGEKERAMRILDSVRDPASLEDKSPQKNSELSFRHPADPTSRLHDSVCATGGSISSLVHASISAVPRGRLAKNHSRDTSSPYTSPVSAPPGIKMESLEPLSHFGGGWCMPQQAFDAFLPPHDILSSVSCPSGTSWNAQTSLEPISPGTSWNPSLDPIRSWNGSANATIVAHDNFQKASSLPSVYPSRPNPPPYPGALRTNPSPFTTLDHSMRMIVEDRPRENYNRSLSDSNQVRNRVHFQPLSCTSPVPSSFSLSSHSEYGGSNNSAGNGNYNHFLRHGSRSPASMVAGNQTHPGAPSMVDSDFDSGFESRPASAVTCYTNFDCDVDNRSVVSDFSSSLNNYELARNNQPMFLESELVQPSSSVVATSSLKAEPFKTWEETRPADYCVQLEDLDKAAFLQLFSDGGLARRTRLLQEIIQRIDNAGTEVYQKETSEQVEFMVKLWQEGRLASDQQVNNPEISILEIRDYIKGDLEKIVSNIMSFASRMPGIKFLDEKDFSTLLEQCIYEMWMIQNSSFLVNNECYLLLMSADPPVQYTRHWMAQFLPDVMIDSQMKFADEMNPCQFTFLELNLLKAIVIVCPDRVNLTERDKIRNLRHLYQEALYEAFNRRGSLIANELMGKVNCLMPKLAALNELHKKCIAPINLDKDKDFRVDENGLA